jgi:hypothetical protein
VLNPRGRAIGQISADLDRADAPDGGPKDTPEDSARQTGRWRVLIAMAPTEPEDGRLPGTDAGTWTVIIRRSSGVRLLDHPIHCWIQRATDFESFRSGSRQSYFDLDAYEATRFTPQGDLSERDCKTTLVKRFGSLNGLATSPLSLVVGGYRLGAGLGSGLACVQPARYSAAGTLKPDWISKTVDCSSMSDRSRVLPGTISTGVLSGSRSLLQGTSAAAPFVARRLAEIFVTADESAVQGAKGTNYLSLLDECHPEAGQSADMRDHGDPRCRRDDLELRKARLGTVLVPPYRQPGLEAPDCDQGAEEYAENK